MKLAETTQSGPMLMAGDIGASFDATRTALLDPDGWGKVLFDMPAVVAEARELTGFHPSPTRHVVVGGSGRVV
jgi:hypothetical protein